MKRGNRKTALNRRADVRQFRSARATAQGNLLDILAETRTAVVLDEIIEKNRDYQNTLECQKEIADRLDSAGLSREQRVLADKAISATNNCGAVYGAAAYRLGLQDGIRLMSEIGKIEQS